MLGAVRSICDISYRSAMTNYHLNFFLKYHLYFFSTFLCVSIPQDLWYLHSSTTFCVFKRIVMCNIYLTYILSLPFINIHIVLYKEIVKAEVLCISKVCIKMITIIIVVRREIIKAEINFVLQFLCNKSDRNMQKELYLYSPQL